MKKRIAFFLAFVLIFGLFSGLSVTAATVPHFYMRPVVTADKTTLTVEIFTDGLRWTAFDGGLKFDPSALTLTNVTVGAKVASAQRNYDFITDHRDVSQSNAAGYCNFVAVAGDPNCSITSYTGAVAVFTFAIKDLARAKTGYDLCLNTLTDAKGEALLPYTSFDLSSPVVYIANADNPLQYGDVNLDGEASIADAMLIMQYKAKIIQWDNLDPTTEYKLRTGDVSGDGEVTVADAMLIMQFLAGMIPSFPIQG